MSQIKATLPPDVQIDFVADQPRVVGDRISHFIREFGIAIAAVVLVTILLLLFRVAVVAAVAIPDVSLFAQHIYQNGVPFLGANNVVAGLRLTCNIFDWGKRAGVIREREAQLAEAEEEVLRIDHRVTIEIEKAFRRVQRVTSVVSVAREALGARREALRLAKDQFELGLSGRAAYEEANAAALAAEADLAAAEYQLEVAIADLDRLSGSR